MQEHHSSPFNYFPEKIKEYITGLVVKYDVRFRLSRPRKTKLGDFKVDIRTGKCIISVNRNLGFEQFLITTIHELAHVVNWSENGRRVAPHGKEWKNIYRELFQPVIPLLEDESFRAAVQLHIKNPKASSYSDTSLVKFFLKEDSLRVEDIPMNEHFQLGERVFIKHKKLRKRYLCIDAKTSKRYYVHALAEVKRP